MTSLAHLSLFANKLSGAIPIEIGEMKSLTNLALSRNKITGTIPPLGKLSCVQWLVLGENQLTGTIPAMLGELTALTHLFLNANRITGTIPAALGELAALTHVDLHDNALSGCVPRSIASCASTISAYPCSVAWPAEWGVAPTASNPEITGRCEIDFSEFLSSHGLAQYLAAFQATGVDKVSDLPSLQENEIKELLRAIVPAHGQKLLNAVREARTEL